MTTHKKRPRDINSLAAKIVEEATSEAKPAEDDGGAPKKNQAAVELGRLGGLKGGKARAAKLTPERMAEIAKKAAAERWKKRRD